MMLLHNCVSLRSFLDFNSSCPKLTEIEERNFWIFEMSAALIGLGSWTVVHSRQKLLDKQLLEKVNKQIAAGV